MLEALLLSVILSGVIGTLIVLVIIALKLVGISKQLWHVKPRETRCVKELAWAVRDVTDALSSGNHQLLKQAICQLEIKAMKVKEAGLA